MVLFSGSYLFPDVNGPSLSICGVYVFPPPNSKTVTRESPTTTALSRNNRCFTYVGDVQNGVRDEVAVVCVSDTRVPDDN